MNSSRLDNGTSSSPVPQSPHPKHTSSNLAVIAVLLALSAVAFFLFVDSRQTPAPRVAGTAPDQRLSGQPKTSRPEQDILVATKPQAPLEQTTESPKSPAAGEILEELVSLSSGPGPLTSQQAARFKELLAKLSDAGAASVPAIRDLLKQGTNFEYITIEGGDQLGFPNLRAALIDTLKQIGGPEAQHAMLQTLQNAVQPAELLALANGLEQIAPGLYGDQIQQAARDSLAAALANPQPTNAEIGPLFRVVQIYNPNTIAGAAGVDPVGFYNALTLANLPNAQGLPSLLQLAQGGNGNSQSVATEMVAQLAGRNSQALDALAQMAQNGQIPNNVWMRLAPILGGDEYRWTGLSPSSGSGSDAQNSFSVVNYVTSPQELNRRIAIIDGLLDYLPPDSAGSRALQNERGILSGRLGR